MTKPAILGDESWLTVQEMADKLGVTTITAYTYLHTAEGLEATMVGNRYYIREASVAAMLKAKTAKRMAAATYFAKAE